MPRQLDTIVDWKCLGYRDDFTSKDDYCYHLYFAVIDNNILGEMNKLFSESNKEIIWLCNPVFLNLRNIQI